MSFADPFARFQTRQQKKPVSPYGATGAMTSSTSAPQYPGYVPPVATTQPVSLYGATGAMTPMPSSQPVSPYGATGAMTIPPSSQPASPYSATGAMTPPPPPPPPPPQASPYDASGAMVQPPSQPATQPASPYTATGALVQPTPAPQPVSPYDASGAMVTPAVVQPTPAPQPVSPYDDSGAMVTPPARDDALLNYLAITSGVTPSARPQASPYSPSGRMYDASPLRTASQQSPYDPLTGAMVAEASPVDQAITSGQQPEAATLPDITSLADYQAVTAGTQPTVDTALADYQALTSGRATSPSMTAGMDATMTPQSYAELTAGRGASVSMTPSEYAAMTAGTDATMTPDEYAAMTAGPEVARMETTPSMTPDEYAAMTAGPGAVEAPSDTLQQALEQAYMRRIGLNDPILSSQLADQQERQRQQEQATIEQLSRYGVLRGGGDTANVLTQMREGQERNRLALEAAAAQRQQQDLRDALSFEQARSQMGLAGRGMTLQERLGAQDIEGSRLQRELQRAGVTGQFRGRDTMAERELVDRLATTAAQRGIAERELVDRLATTAAQRGAITGAERRADIAQEAGLFGEVAGQGSARARQTMAGRQLDEALLASQAQRTALGGAERRADIAQEAGLFGEVAGQGMGFPRATMAGQEADLRRELARNADERAAQAQQAQLFGQVVGQGGPIQTLGGMQALEAIEGQRLAREATEAGLTGQFRGAQTAAERAQRSALDTQDLQRRLAEAGVTGDFDLGGSARPVQTLQAQALASEMQGQALQRALQRAGATGEFIEEGADADAAVPTLERRLREAALIGALAPATFGEDAKPTQTLAGQAAEMDRIGAALAAVDPSLDNQMTNLASYLLGDIDPGLAINTRADFTDSNMPSTEEIEDLYPGVTVEGFETIDGTEVVTLSDGSTVQVGSDALIRTMPDGGRSILLRKRRR